MTRRVCGQSCIAVDKLTEEHFQRAVRNLLSFDVVFTMEGMGKADTQALCDLDQRWCQFVKTQKPMVAKPSGIHEWLAGHAGSPVAKRILDITAMDKRLYAVAQARQAGLPILNAEQFF